MSNSIKLNESLIENKNREVVILLQIPKTLIIEKNTTIGDLKRLSKQHFGKYSEDFSLFIKDFDISTLENMNAIRTLDYYKSNTLSLFAKGLKKNLNDSNFLLSKDMNTDADYSQSLFDSKEKTNEIYTNMENLQRKVEEFKKKSNKEYSKINQTDEVVNRSYAYLKNYNYRDLEIPEANSANEMNKSHVENNALSPRNLNISNYFEKNSDVMKTLKKDVYSQSNQNIMKNRSELLQKDPSIHKFNIQTNERSKQFNIANQTLSPIRSYNDSIINENMINSKTNEYNVPKEEYDNIYMTNKILNKSNIELKNHIKSLENDLESSKEMKQKIQEMSRIMENMNNNMSNYEERIKESGELIENLNKINSELSLENRTLRNELEGINGNIEYIDKTNYELKQQIDTMEHINSKSDNEKNHLVSHLSEKDNIISELNEKIRCLNDVISSTKKSCRDYEDMLNGMKRTIDIMKKSCDDGDSEFKRTKMSLNEIKNSLEKKNEEYINLEKINTSILNEKELLKNEIAYLNTEVNNKEKVINEHTNSIRNAQMENEKMRFKIDSLNKIFEDKDKTIENMKISVATLNKNLEEYKFEYDNIKRKFNDELGEKNKLTRSKEQFDYTFTEFKKQIDELTKLKDNLYKQNFALEEDNSELRSKFYNMRNENDNLTMKITFLNENITELNNQLSVINNSKTVIDHEKVNLNMKITELSNKINQFHSVEISFKNQIENLNSTIVSKDKSIENLLKSKDEVNQELFSYKEKLKSIYNEKNKIIEELENKSNEIKYIENKVKRDNEKYTNDMKLKDIYIENLNKTSEEYKAKINQFNTQKDNEIFVLEKTVEDLKKNLMESREKENSSKIEKLEYLNDAKYKNKFIENLEATVRDLNENLIIHKRNSDRLNNLNRDYLEELQEFKSKNEKLNKKLEFDEYELIKLNQIVSELRLSNQELLNNYNTIKKEFSNAKFDREKIDEEKKKLNNIENLKTIIVSNSCLGMTDTFLKNQKSVKFDNSSIDTSLINTQNNSNIRNLKENLPHTSNENSQITDDLNFTNISTRNNLFNKHQSKLTDFSFEKPKDNSEEKLENSPERRQTNDNSKSTTITKSSPNLRIPLNNTEKNLINPSEIQIKTSEANTKLERRKSEKINILEGSKLIFSIFDSKRILRFDLEDRVFKLIEFADFGNFESHFSPQGSIYLNIYEGLLIVTGENHDQFFHYSNSKHSMNRLSKLNNNHSYGSMIYYSEGNSIICLSGWHNKRVEKYVNDEVISNYLKIPKNYPKKIEKQLKNTWNQLPELTIERSESTYVVFDKFLYGFFGFNCPQMKYLDSIERINLDNPLMWELVSYKNDHHISTFIKSHASIQLNNNEVLFVGGYDGLNDCPIENFSFFNVKKNEYYKSDRKFPDISKNHIYNFQKNGTSVPYIDIHNRLHLVAVDEKDVVHVVEAKTLQYDLFISFD